MSSDHNRHVQPRAPPPRAKKPRPVLRTHKRAFFLLAFYIPIVLIPWIITATLSYRPLTKPSWTYAPGISYKDYKLIQGWARAIPILNAVAAILAIPIISSIMAQAAVVFAQRRHPGQKLSVRQLFSLADRSWGNPRTLHDILWWSEPGHARVNWFLVACTGLVVLGAVQFPLYQLLVPWKEIAIPTCEDTEYIDYGVGKQTCDFNYRASKELGYTQIGIDLEPAQMAVIPQQYILPRIRNDLATLSTEQAQPYAWKNPLSYDDRTIAYDSILGFVAALPDKATTGVLREHIMRLNSTVSCLTIETSEFPATCSGENPFQASLAYKELYMWGSPGNISTLDICAPGNLGKHPWTVSRNRQELSEEVFLRFTDRDDEGVLHCTGQTTRGYFELGNNYNADTFGPLLEKWPSSGSTLDEIQSHDFMRRDWGGSSESVRQNGYMLSEEDTVLGGAQPVPDRRTWRDYGDSYPADTYTNMSGPLMTSVLALFGDNSWVHELANLTSERDEDNDALKTMYSDRPALLRPLCDALPFGRFRNSVAGSEYRHDDCPESLLDLMMSYSDHMNRWSLNSTATHRLNIAMFLANQAALTSHTAGYLLWSSGTGREIYTAPGIKVWKPSVSLPSLIILSMIVGVQVLGLLWLGWWILKWPTWTRTLDAMAIARVAASIDPSLLPPFKATGQKYSEKLAHVDGLVGTHLQGFAIEQQRDPGVVLRETREEADIEMRALSVASTVGKEPTSEAVPAAPETTSSVSLGLGAPGLVSRKWEKQARPAQSSDQGDESV